MIDIQNERLLSMPQAAAMLPNRPSLSALWRWRTKGVRGRKLETAIIGGRPFTSVEALGRFARHEGGSDAPATRTPAARDRAIRRAAQELSDNGI